MAKVLILLALLGSLYVCCSQSTNGRDGERAPAKDGRIVQEIEAMPAWSELQAGDARSREEILARLESLAQYDLEPLRTAISDYMAMKRQSQEGYNVASMSRLYVLNRYLFDLPEKIPFESAKFFGGWIGVPYNEKELEVLWPLSQNPDGKLELTGRFGGYAGDDYLAVGEFDYFRERFGVRRRPQPQKP